MVGSLFAQEKSQIIDNQYQITASTTLENLAIEKKSERQRIGGGLLAGSGMLFSILDGDAKVAGVIVGGIGILVLLIKEKSEKNMIV